MAGAPHPRTAAAPCWTETAEPGSLQTALPSGARGRLTCGGSQEGAVLERNPLRSPSPQLCPLPPRPSHLSSPSHLGPGWGLRKVLFFLVHLPNGSQECH